MDINKELIEYCKENVFPINDMDINDFKKVEKTLEYQVYLFRKSINELFNPMLKWMINIVDKFNSN